MNSQDFELFFDYLDGSPAFLQHAGGSDCLTAVEGSPEVPRGVVCMDAVSRYNMRVVTDEAYELSVWEGPQEAEHLNLSEVHCQVKLLSAADLGRPPSASESDSDGACHPAAVSVKD